MWLFSAKIALLKDICLKLLLFDNNLNFGIGQSLPTIGHSKYFNILYLSIFKDFLYILVLFRERIKVNGNFFSL